MKKNKILEKMVVRNSKLLMTPLPDDVSKKHLFIWLNFLEYFQLRRLNIRYYRYFTEILNSLQFKPSFLWFQDEYDRKKIFDDYEKELKNKEMQALNAGIIYGHRKYIESKFKVEIFSQLIENRNKMLLSRIPTLLNGPYELKLEVKEAINVLTTIINQLQDAPSLDHKMPSSSEVKEAITTVNTFYTRAHWSLSPIHEFIALSDEQGQNVIWRREKLPKNRSIESCFTACMCMFGLILLVFTGLFLGDGTHNSKIFSLSSNIEKTLGAVFLFVGLCCCCCALCHFMDTKEGEPDYEILNKEVAKTQSRLNAILTQLTSTLPMPALTSDVEISIYEEKTPRREEAEEKKGAKKYRPHNLLPGLNSINGDSKNRYDSLKTPLLEDQKENTQSGKGFGQ